MKIYSKKMAITVSFMLVILLCSTSLAFATFDNFFRPKTFKRIATFPVFLNTDVELETVAEIITSAKNGNLLVYTDSETENIGFVDITNPANPLPAGVVKVAGEPTSVAVKKNYALAAVNTSDDFVNTSGLLQVIDINSRLILRDIELGGQPDSIAVSPNGRYAAIAIENERDEDLDDGRPPQAPAGFVVIVDLVGPPDNWKIRTVDLVGIPDLFPPDPEPEFIDINKWNIAAVTLQENNHMVLINLRRGKVVRDWPLGSVDLEDIDTLENDLIEPFDSQPNRLREPDAVAWISDFYLATADEGDLDGGSRGFTVFTQRGQVLSNSGASVEHLVTRFGHYPENRSENKGNEPEGIEFGRYGENNILFVGSERSSVVNVYTLRFPWSKPKFLQTLPGGVEPEGLLAIPKRGLFVTASEEDSRDDKIRAMITIYKRSNGEPTYPTIKSANDLEGLPIPWGALSALAADLNDPGLAYTAYDSFYKKSRIFTLNVSDFPAIITDEIILTDKGATVDLDVEGLAARGEGGFWVVSEGAGSVDDPKRPVTSMNQLFKVASNGIIEHTIPLPDSVNDLQRRFGFEGVAEDGIFVYVAFQREWVGDPGDRVRIGRYNTETGDWEFYYYPLDTPTSPNGGWVGLSEIVSLGNNTFAVIERDNQAGTDARIKKIYKFSVDGLIPQTQESGEAFPLLTKTLARDLILDLEADNGPVLEKVEGLMVTINGDAYIVTDNDGVDDSSGETQLINIGTLK